MENIRVALSDHGLVAASVFLSAAGLTTLLCLFARPLGAFLGVMDMPSGGDGHKRHKNPTPAVGGIILAIVGLIIFFASMPYSVPDDAGARYIRTVSLGAVLVTMLMGFLDDRKHIPAIIRLVTSLAILTTLFLLVPKFQIGRVVFTSINLDVQTGWLALPFTILCVLTLKNAINMADGRNGLILGMSLIWNVFFLFHALPHMIATLIGILGILAALFIFNVRGKLFMGDCGSYGLATYFGILVLSLHSNAYGTVRSAEAVLLFLIPVLDTVRLIFVRMANGQSPLAPDGQHLHHLLDRTMGWKRGWAIYMALVAVPMAIFQLTHGIGVHIIVTTAAIYALVIFFCSRALRVNDEGLIAGDAAMRSDQAGTPDTERLAA